VRAAPKWKNGQKHAGEGRSGSVAGVDERRVAWPCMEESEGGKRRGKHGGVGWLFEAETARQWRGFRGWSPHGGRERGRERGGQGTTWDSAGEGRRD
jgi:hypothetical protein